MFPRRCESTQQRAQAMLLFVLVSLMRKSLECLPFSDAQTQAHGRKPSPVHLCVRSDANSGFQTHDDA